jgi:hypothetical protein
MPAVDEPVLVRISASPEPTSDFMERPFTVVSERMRAALDRTGVDNVQFIEARVQREWSEQVETGYWLMNVVGVVSCVDRLASGLDCDDDVPLVDIPRLVIDRSRTLGFDIFRLAEDIRMIVVSPRVQAALVSAGLRGVLIQDPALYAGGRATSRAELAQASGQLPS